MNEVEDIRLTGRHIHQPNPGIFCSLLSSIFSPLLSFASIFPCLLDSPAPPFFPRNHQLPPADGPKVIGKISVVEVFVGHGEIALQTPIGSPGVADNKTLIGIISEQAP